MSAYEPHPSTHTRAGGPFPWLFAYFRQIYSQRVDLTPTGVHFTPLTEEDLLIEALHLAYSYDGIHWTPLNGNQPVQLSALQTARIRDPFVRRGLDGYFHLLATGGAARTDIYYAKSSDLIHWDEHRSLSVMGSSEGARNAWAPEFLVDPDRGDYFVFWSTSHGRFGWDDSRIWWSRTTDFLTFSPPRLLFDPGFTVIDATIVPFEGTFYMFFKDERFGHEHGEHRYIQVTTAANLEGPYTIATEPVTPSITEGPALMRAADGRWFLFFDRCMENSYSVAIGHDLLHWQEVANAHFPPNARHGSVLAVTEQELSMLRRELDSEGSAARPMV